MAMKCALGFCFETLAMDSRAVAFTPTTLLDKLSRGLTTSSFPKSKFLMATLFVVILTDSANELVSSRRCGTDSVNGRFVHGRWDSVN